MPCQLLNLSLEKYFSLIMSNKMSLILNKTEYLFLNSKTVILKIIYVNINTYAFSLSNSAKNLGVIF